MSGLTECVSCVMVTLRMRVVKYGGFNRPDLPFSDLLLL